MNEVFIGRILQWPTVANDALPNHTGIMQPDHRRRLRYGPYATPRFRYGTAVTDACRGDVVIVAISNGRIPWPVGRVRGNSNRALIVYGGEADRPYYDGSLYASQCIEAGGDINRNQRSCTRSRSTMHDELHSQGWGLDELAYEQAGRLIRQIDAHSGEKWIVDRERNQTAAWREAWREAKTRPDAGP